MKKFIVVLMALLFAGSAFAQDAPKGAEFKYGVWANAFAITHDFVNKDVKEDYSTIRVRPQFTATMENVSVVTRFEIDQNYGSKLTAATGANDVSYADADGDEKAVEVKWAYINVKDMLVPGLSMTAGLAPYVFSVGFNNDMPQFNLVYDAGMVKVDLAYVKYAEGAIIEETAAAAPADKTEDDTQIYSGKLPITLGDIVITPAVAYVKGEENALWKDGASASAIGEVTETMPAIGLKFKADALTIDADFQYIMGEIKAGAAKMDIAAYGAFLNIGFKVSDALSVNLFGEYATGEGDKADEMNSFADACIDEYEMGPLFIINDNGFIGQTGVTTDEADTYSEGLMAGGLAVNFKADKLSALCQVAYAQTTSDKVVKDQDLGIEVDLRLAYEVAPKTSLWAEGAMLMAGKYYETKLGDNQDAMYYAAGLMTNL